MKSMMDRNSEPRPFRAISRESCGTLRALRGASLVALAMVAFSKPSLATELPGPTGLTQISVGGGLSTSVRSLESTPAMLSNGAVYRLQKFYSSNWRDLSVTFVTELSSEFGIYWGFKTGESGPKYRIAPALNLGFIFMKKLTSDSAVSVSVTGVLGGWLNERPCIANYGAIGGIQDVNCRLASSFLPPAQTLKYLLHLPPENQMQITVRYQWNF